MSRPWNVFFLFRDHLECLNIQHEDKTWALQQKDHSVRKRNFKQKVLPPWSPLMLPITFLCPWSKLSKLSELQAVSIHLFYIQSPLLHLPSSLTCQISAPRTAPWDSNSVLPKLTFKSSQGSWRNVWSWKQVEAARSNLCSSLLMLVTGSF